jgi:hypothetical protein
MAIRRRKNLELMIDAIDKKKFNDGLILSVVSLTDSIDQYYRYRSIADYIYTYIYICICIRISIPIFIPIRIYILIRIPIPTYT